MRKRQGFGVFILLAAATAMAAVACGRPDTSPAATTTPHPLTFTISHIIVEPSGKTNIELAVANEGTQELPADQYVAHFALAYADGTLRATSDAVLPRIPPSTGDLNTVISLNTPLEAGEYHASWGASGLGSTLVTFEIVAQDGGLQLGEQIAQTFGPGHPYPTSALRQQ